MGIRAGQEWLFAVLAPVLRLSIVIAIVLTVVLIVLRLQKSTPVHVLRSVAIMTAVVWIITIVAFFGLVSVLTG